MSHFRIKDVIKNKWSITNKQRTLENIQISQRDCDDQSDSSDNDITIDHDEDGESDSSLSSTMSELNAFDTQNTAITERCTDTKLKHYGEYIENIEFIASPHHDNSLLYVQNEKTEMSYSDEKCYWVFPKQHGHKSEIFIIRQIDYNRLPQQQWLNDDIINFGIKYIYASWPSALKNKVYIFNSFFFSALKPILIKESAPTQEEMIQIQKQTKSFCNIFDREYILIPICDKNHWELVIVWRHNIVFEQRQCDEKCYLLLLDSLNGTKKSHLYVFKIIKRWLNLQYVRMSGGNEMIKVFESKTVSTHCIQVPKQPNYIDCGCFLLRNVCQFGRDGGFNINDKSKREWYSQSDGVRYRYSMQCVLDQLIKEQETYVVEMQKKLKMNEFEALCC